MKEFTVFYRDLKTGFTSCQRVNMDDHNGAMSAFQEAYLGVEVIGVLSGHVKPLFWEGHWEDDYNTPFDGADGHDRESYSDDQDRDSYTVGE